MENGPKTLTDSEILGWTNDQLLEFYNKFSVTAFQFAAQHDEEMMSYVNALGYLQICERTKTVIFEKVSKNEQHEIVKNEFLNFLLEFENRVDIESDYSSRKNLFSYVLKDSEMGTFGRITNMENAVYAMRDEVICVMISKVIKKFGPNLYNIPEYQSNLKSLIKYNPIIHRGVKYNCYKNQFISDSFGVMFFGVSMLTQQEIKNENMGCFDSFCDHFEIFFEKVMNNCGIEKDGKVDEDSYSSDMKMIIDHLSQRNVWFYEQNYELIEVDYK